MNSGPYRHVIKCSNRVTVTLRYARYDAFDPPELATIEILDNPNYAIEAQIVPCDLGEALAYKDSWDGRVSVRHSGTDQATVTFTDVERIEHIIRVPLIVGQLIAKYLGRERDDLYVPTQQ